MHTTRRASSKINQLTIDDEILCRITWKQMSWKLEREERGSGGARGAGERGSEERKMRR